MIYKLLIAGAGMALSFVVARKLTEAQAASRVKVKTKDERAVRGSRLRQNPETGVYYPEG
jgi:hypothetical protein